MMLSFIFFVGLVFFSIPALLTFLIFVLMVLKIGPWRLKANIERSLSLPPAPPGPWKLPIIGNLHHLVGSLPHHRLRNLANNYGPIMYLQIGEHPTILVSSPQSAKGVMQTHDEFFATRVETVATKIMTYDFSGVSFAPYGDQWIELRKICTMELSSKKRDQSFRYDREEEVSEVIRSIASKAGSVTNLSDIVSSLAYNLFLKIAFRSKCKEQRSSPIDCEGICSSSSGFQYFRSVSFHQISTIDSWGQVSSGENSSTS